MESDGARGAYSGPTGSRAAPSERVCDPVDFDRPRHVIALATVLRGAGRRRAVTYDELAPAAVCLRRRTG